MIKYTCITLQLRCVTVKEWELWPVEQQSPFVRGWGEGGLGEVRLLDICKTPKEKSTRTQESYKLGTEWGARV